MSNSQERLDILDHLASEEHARPRVPDALTYHTAILDNAFSVGEARIVDVCGLTMGIRRFIAPEGMKLPHPVTGALGDAADYYEILDTAGRFRQVPFVGSDFPGRTPEEILAIGEGIAVAVASSRLTGDDVSLDGRGYSAAEIAMIESLAQALEGNLEAAGGDDVSTVRQAGIGAENPEVPPVSQDEIDRAFILDLLSDAAVRETLKHSPFGTRTARAIEPGEDFPVTVEIVHLRAFEGALVRNEETGNVLVVPELYEIALSSDGEPIATVPVLSSDFPDRTPEQMERIVRTFSRELEPLMEGRVSPEELAVDWQEFGLDAREASRLAEAATAVRESVVPLDDENDTDGSTPWTGEIHLSSWMDFDVA